MKKANLARAVSLRTALAFGQFGVKFSPKFTGVNLANVRAKFNEKFEIFFKNAVKFARLNLINGFVKSGLNLMNMRSLASAPIRFMSSNLWQNKYISAPNSKPNLTNSASHKFNQITAVTPKSNENFGVRFSADENSTAKILATKFYAVALNETVKFITPNPKRKNN